MTLSAHIRCLHLSNGTQMQTGSRSLSNTLGGDLARDDVDGVLRQDDELLADLVYLGDGRSVFLFAFHKEFLVPVFPDADDDLPIKRVGVIVEHDRAILGNTELDAVGKTLGARKGVLGLGLGLGRSGHSYVRLPLTLFKYLSLGLFGLRYILSFMQRMGLSLQDASNYSDELSASSSEAFAKYGLLINEFLRLASTARRQPEKKGELYAEILAKGIRTLTHVFRFLLLYTRNLDLTWHHCQKAAYYYVEFMGQIGGDAHGFLQLNARDAALFVYRKTVFEINDQHRREFGSVVGQDDRWDNLHILTCVFGKAAEELVMAKAGPMDLTERLLPLSRALLNLALVGTEGGYMQRLEMVKWLDSATADWGGQRLLILESFARKLRGHKCRLSELKLRFSRLPEKEEAVAKPVAKLVSWLVGRRTRVP